MIARPHMEMIGIAKHDLTVDGFEIAGRECALDRACRCDIHKAGRLEIAVNGTEHTASGSIFCFEQFKHPVLDSFFRYCLYHTINTQKKQVDISRNTF